MDGDEVVEAVDDELVPVGFDDKVDMDDEPVVEADDELTFIIKSTKSSENMGTYYAKVINEFGEVPTNKATLTINRNLKKILLFFINFL